MTIDFWGLGLQAVNVLILVWLMSRVFWRPVAGAIARRQEATRATMDAAEAAQAKADATLAELTQARAGIAAEREAMLDAARAEAQAAAQVTLVDTQTVAEARLAAAQTAIDQATEAARKANAAKAADLSVDIAARLLERLNSPTVQDAFLSLLVKAIADMPAADRAALVAKPGGIEIVGAAEPGADREKIEKAVRDALGGNPALHFVTDPALIAGLELRNAHFVLHNSWQADLSQVRKAVKDAA